MISYIPKGVKSIFEPTPGKGNLLNSLFGYNVEYPNGDFFDHKFERYYDAILMNPPFSPMSKGYEILFECMKHSDLVIAIMPWLTIINSTKRTNILKNFGIRHITHLPRNAFKGSRVQTCILVLDKNYSGVTTIDFMDV